eukprot:Gb_03425 [translate_table: standard]
MNGTLRSLLSKVQLPHIHVEDKPELFHTHDDSGFAVGEERTPRFILLNLRSRAAIPHQILRFFFDPTNCFPGRAIRVTIHCQRPFHRAVSSSVSGFGSLELEFTHVHLAWLQLELTTVDWYENIGEPWYAELVWLLSLLLLLFGDCHSSTSRANPLWLCRPPINTPNLLWQVGLEVTFGTEVIVNPVASACLRNLHKK